MNIVQFMQEIVSYCICVFEVYMFYTFMHKMMPERFSLKYIRILILFSVITLSYTVNTFQNSTLNLIANSFLYLCMVLVLFKEKCWKKLLYTFVGWAVLIAGDFLTGFIWGYIDGFSVLKIEFSAYNSLVGVFSAKLISFAIFKLIEYISNIKNNKFAVYVGICFCIIPIATILIYTGLIYTSDDYGIITKFFEAVLLIGCFCLLMANILLFHVYEKIIWSINKAKELESYETKNKMEKIHYERLNEMNSRYNSILHDLSHYLRTIGNLALKNDDRKIIEILEKIDVNIQNAGEKIYCSNEITNAILNDKQVIADEKQIQYKVTIEPAFNIDFVDDYDLISILSNILDNALEAAEKCEPGTGYVHITMKMINNGGFSMIHVTNNFVVKPIKGKRFFESIKPDKEIHGIGINNVSEITAKYGGFLKTEVKGANFETHVILSNQLTKND